MRYLFVQQSLTHSKGMMSIIMVDTAIFYAMDFMEMIIILQYFGRMGTEA